MENFDETLNNFLYKFVNDSTYAINGLMRQQSMEDMKKGRLKGYQPDIFYSAVDKDFIKSVLSINYYFASTKGIEIPLTVFRGCNDIEKDGVSGLVSTSLSPNIASWFDRGTFLKINLPKGMKVIETAPLYAGSSDFEYELILPPCSYKILKEEWLDTGNINNPSGRTRILEIDVKPKNFLRELCKRLKNPPVDYFKEHNSFGEKVEFWALLDKLCGAQIGTILSFTSSPLEIEGQDYLIGQDEFLSETRHFSDKKTQMATFFESLKTNGTQVDNEVVKNSRTKQIQAEEFYDYIKNSQHFHILQEYLTSDDHLQFYQANNDGFHDARHADNATLFAYYIASKKNLNEFAIRLVLEGARYHDCGRTTSKSKSDHASVGARLYEKHTNETLPFYESKLVSMLIETHSLPSKELVENFVREKNPVLQDEEAKSLCMLSQIIRDSDVLDHVNVGFHYGHLRESMLDFPESKELINVASVLNRNQDLAKSQKTLK